MQHQWKICGMAIATLAAVAAPAELTFTAPTPEQFQNYWYADGAEISRYALSQSRYGGIHEGDAVLIFVTEKMNPELQVKADNPTEADIPILKLNALRKFYTGIYPYSVMTSVFTPIATGRSHAPLKITTSAQEWCGHVYTELLFDATRVQVSNSSYFEDESGIRLVPLDHQAISEDNLFVRLRGLRGDFLGPGDSKTIDYLPGVFFSRLSHQAVNPTRATISRRARSTVVEVPAGRFSVMVYDVKTDGRDGVFYIETAYPHRIVRWELAPDVKGELTGSLRTQYWNLNREGDEKHFEQLGIPVYGR